jgi:hypothetical protein
MEVADQPGADEAQQEHDLIEEEELAAPLRPDQLVDIGAGDRNLAAGADPLDETKGHHHAGSGSEQACDIHADEEQDREQKNFQPADLLGKPAKQDRTDQLPQIAHRQDHAGL